MLARIVIATHDDPTFAFRCWAETIPALIARGHQVVGLALVPSHLGRLRGLSVPLWYLNQFGVGDFLRLALYSVAARIGSALFGRGQWKVRGWSDFGHHGIKVMRYRNANDPEFIHELQAIKADIILITVDDILKKDVISAPRLGCINKHSAVLPSCRGLFPFFWALMYGMPIGVTYHLVDVGIDTGRMLNQKRHADSWRALSMLSFYRKVFSEFPKEMCEAVEALINGVSLQAGTGIEPSYFGLPSAQDVAEFKRQGHRISRWGDVFGGLS